MLNTVTCFTSCTANIIILIHFDVLSLLSFEASLGSSADGTTLNKEKFIQIIHFHTFRIMCHIFYKTT